MSNILPNVKSKIDNSNNSKIIFVIVFLLLCLILAFIYLIRLDKKVYYSDQDSDGYGNRDKWLICGIVLLLKIG